MIKEIITSSAAVAILGSVGVANIANQNNTANADTTQTQSVKSQAQLAYLAHHNPSVLNKQPIQQGAYNISFYKNGYTYNFNSNGHNFSWNYQYGNHTNQTTSKQTAPKATTYKPVKSVAYNTTPKQNKVASSSLVNKKQTPVRQASAVSHNRPAQTTGGSVKSQFLANGGTEAAWNAIVMPESGGNPSAVSPNGYHGLGQTKESWGYGSVASQTKGFVNYANSRYGSIDNAIAFRQSHGWW